jgi:hypothetical protein
MSELGNPAAAAACFNIGASNSTYRVDVVVSGSIAAILPLPAAASEVNAFIAEKSLVNDVAEMLGVPADDVVPAAPVDALVDELDELPHAASVTAPSATRTAIAALLLSKCM